MNDKILVSVEDDVIEEKIDQSDVFSEHMQQCICHIEQLILSKPSLPAITYKAPQSCDNPSKPPDDTVTDADPTDTIPPLKTTDSGSEFKLPKLVPKSFNGEVGSILEHF